MKTSSNCRVACAFAAHGIPVFPCRPSGPRVKQPLTANGHHAATIDSEGILAWWEQWPDAIVGIPAGAVSGVWILDVDGEIGRRSLNALLLRLSLELLADLTACLSRTPSGGLHLIFSLLPGQRPRNRAGDIGANLDTRGVKADGTSAGYFIAPGSMLPDARRYQAIDASTMEPRNTLDTSFAHAHSAPRRLLYLATFSAAERAVIASHDELREAIRTAEPCDWLVLLRRHQARQRAVLDTHIAGLPRDVRGMRAQALHDLRAGARAYADLENDRRNRLFGLAARVARYVANGVLTDAEVRTALLAAAAANGALTKHGRHWADACISRALALGRADPLPPLARRFKTEDAP